MNTFCLFAQLAGGTGGYLGNYMLAMCIAWALGTLASVFWFLMFIEAFGRERTGNEKFWWVMVILLIPFFGALAYFIIRRPRHSRYLVRAGRPGQGARF